MASDSSLSRSVVSYTEYRDIGVLGGAELNFEAQGPVCVDFNRSIRLFDPYHVFRNSRSYEPVNIRPDSCAIRMSVNPNYVDPALKRGILSGQDGKRQAYDDDRFCVPVGSNPDAVTTPSVATLGRTVDRNSTSSLTHSEEFDELENLHDQELALRCAKVIKETIKALERVLTCIRTLEFIKGPCFREPSRAQTRSNMLRRLTRTGTQ
ncbi:unnamed protein product [Peniophora sp. CBMAI 1063]|nr:unnamed protein product [Peniophora sp. CBMAI 1063]